LTPFSGPCLLTSPFSLHLRFFVVRQRQYPPFLMGRALMTPPFSDLFTGMWHDFFAAVRRALLACAPQRFYYSFLLFFSDICPPALFLPHHYREAQPQSLPMPFDSFQPFCEGPHALSTGRLTGRASETSARTVENPF